MKLQKERFRGKGHWKDAIVCADFANDRGSKCGFKFTYKEGFARGWGNQAPAAFTCVTS